MTWRVKSEALTSKGVTSKKAVSLADLHRRREETQSQYFTPAWIAAGIWSVLSRALPDQRKTVTVLDSSIGSGRLFEGAPMDRLSIYGIDVDARCIAALSDDAASAGLTYQFNVAGIEDLDASNFDFAVINPPFSLHLESANLKAHYPSTSFGRFGPGTAALSHEYALDQALEAATVVAAVLPVSMEGYCRETGRLRAIINLPHDTFRIEGANVQTGVYFFDSSVLPRDVVVQTVTADQAWPVIALEKPDYYRLVTRFRVAGAEYSKPVITLPVTGDRRVEMHHHNRRLVLKYRCGLVQAKVHNALLGGAAWGHRLPGQIRYTGDGQFFLDVLLVQDDPETQLERLAQKINDLGGDAWISPTLDGYYKKLVKRHQIAKEPMHRVIKGASSNTLEIKARRRLFMVPFDFTSPVIRKDEIITAEYENGDYVIRLKDKEARFNRSDLLNRFEIIKDCEGNGSGWSVLHRGLNKAFPTIAANHAKRIDQAGIDWLAPFQRDSLIEGLVSPYGYIGAWEQGSGKARYALALALMHSGRNMIALESGLLPEMLREIEKLGLPEDTYKVLKSGDMPTAKINLVSYPTLRSGARIRYMKTVTRFGKTVEEPAAKVVRTNAERWRRMINVLVCDEGGVLANLNTQQTQAVKRLAARKLIILDGTPQRNYPRDLLPLSVASAGNGMAHQPYGVKGKPEVEARLLTSANEAKRGEDAFYDRHVVTQWVTNEFKEEMQSGFKREVPKINNLAFFREWLAPNIQRRLRSEPDLAIFNKCKTPTRTEYDIEWDSDHLHYYVKTAVEFADWYKRARSGSKAVNLLAILARIGAVQRAANSPHVTSDASPDSYAPLTSKQRFAIDRVKHWVGEEKKIILYAKSPEVLKRLYGRLGDEGIDAVLFTGQQDINTRSRELDERFRFGDTQVLLSSWVGQRGLNLEQAGVVIFYERDWSATTEEQAIFRTQRPTQTQQVQVEYLHLAGSIDEYQAQLVAWKKRAADAGLDFGAQASEDEEFMHLDTILHRFCEDALNMSARDLIEQSP